MSKYGRVIKELAQQRQKWNDLNEYCYKILNDILNQELAQVWLSYPVKERPPMVKKDKALLIQKLQSQMPEFSRIIAKMKQLVDMLPITYESKHEQEIIYRFELELQQKLEIMQFKFDGPLEDQCLAMLSIWKYQPSLFGLL